MYGPWSRQTQETRKIRIGGLGNYLLALPLVRCLGRCCTLVLKLQCREIPTHKVWESHPSGSQNCVGQNILAFFSTNNACGNYENRQLFLGGTREGFWGWGPTPKNAGLSGGPHFWGGKNPPDREEMTTHLLKHRGTKKLRPGEGLETLLGKGTSEGESQKRRDTG